MFEVVSEDDLGKKYDNISEESTHIKLKWNYCAQQDDGVPTEGFALQLREEGSSVSFPSRPKQLMARHEGRI